MPLQDEILDAFPKKDSRFRMEGREILKLDLESQSL